MSEIMVNRFHRIFLSTTRLFIPNRVFQPAEVFSQQQPHLSHLAKHRSPPSPFPSRFMGLLTLDILDTHPNSPISLFFFPRHHLYQTTSTLQNRLALYTAFPTALLQSPLTLCPTSTFIIVTISTIVTAF